MNLNRQTVQGSIHHPYCVYMESYGLLMDTSHSHDKPRLFVCVCSFCASGVSALPVAFSKDDTFLSSQVKTDIFLNSSSPGWETHEVKETIVTSVYLTVGEVQKNDN